MPRDIAMNSVGRNDLCPCGSGKKFKKCCGRVPGASVSVAPQPAGIEVAQTLQVAVLTALNFRTNLASTF